MFAYLVDAVIVFFLVLAGIVLLALVTPLAVRLLSPLERLAVAEPVAQRAVGPDDAALMVDEGPTAAMRL